MSTAFLEKTDVEEVEQKNGQSDVDTIIEEDEERRRQEAHQTDVQLRTAEIKKSGRDSIGYLLHELEVTCVIYADKFNSLMAQLSGLAGEMNEQESLRYGALKKATMIHGRNPSYQNDAYRDEMCN